MSTFNYSIDILRYSVKKKQRKMSNFFERRTMYYENLTKVLKERNLTLNKLAKETGIAQSPTSRWKNGTMPNAETLIKICKYLNISADYLLDLDDGAPPENISDDEKDLLNDYRLCDTGTKKNIRILAASGREETLRQETLSNLKNIG